MDATNERRIFNLLVKMTGRPGSSQYFLLTPKVSMNSYNYIVYKLVIWCIVFVNCIVLTAYLRFNIYRNSDGALRL